MLEISHIFDALEENVANTKQTSYCINEQILNAYLYKRFTHQYISQICILASYDVPSWKAIFMMYVPLGKLPVCRWLELIGLAIIIAPLSPITLMLAGDFSE